MKSMFVVAENKVNSHIGEEYDIIVEVPNEPTTENIKPYADRVMAGIDDLWKEDSGSEDRRIVVHLDAASPFAAMLVNLQIIMKAQAGINIDLPWNAPEDLDALDRESKEILAKLEHK